MKLYVLFIYVDNFYHGDKLELSIVIRNPISLPYLIELMEFNTPILQCEYLSFTTFPGRKPL